MSPTAVMTKASGQTIEKQKAILGSKVLHSLVSPVEFHALQMQMKITAALEGRPFRALDEKELWLAAADREIKDLEVRQMWLAVLAASMMYSEKGRGDTDG